MKISWKNLVVTVIALALILILLFSRQEVVPPQKPSPERTPQWYLISKATQQISTAYTEVSGAPPSASAQPYFIGGVAVHPKVAGGSHLDPIIPFGTIIMLEKPESITIQGKTLNAFTVIDTGDANWGRYGDSPYWVDFYFGTGGYWNNQAALEYGQRPIDFYWYEPFE